MSALTRILNNQIYNSTIVASQKIAAGTITGSLFASNITVPGDFLITGNLFVLGSSQTTTVASTNTYVNDPLVVLNNGFAGANSNDEGFIFNRGTSDNKAFIWNESLKEFRLITTTETGTTYGNITATMMANLSVGRFVAGESILGTLSVGTITGTSLNVSGNVLASTIGASYVTASTMTVGNIAAVNFGNASAIFTGASINLSGNVLAAAGVYNALTVNGNETVTGYLNVTGNVMAAVVTASQLNTTGNVLAQAAVVNALTVNGNESVTGYLNVTGNVMGADATFSSATVNGLINSSANVLATGLSVFGNARLGLAGQVSGSWINVIGNITQTSSGGAVYFNTTGNISAAVGAFGSINSTGYINTSGNISTPQLNAGQVNTTGNVVAQAAVVNALTVNGDETVTGYLNVTGNILSAGAIHNALTVNGDETVTGYLNVTGNILGSTGTLSILGVSNTLWANSSAGTTTQGTGALIVPTGGISVAGAANIAGAFTTAGAAQFNNTVTVGGVSTFTNTSNATDASGATGALRIQGGASLAKDLWVGGNIYASNIFGVSHQIITVKDPLVYFDAANTYPYNYDIGFYSNFVGPNPLTNTGNVYQHSGVIRDNADNTWKFFSNVRSEPSGGSISIDSDTIYDPVRAGNLTLTYTQAATSTTTGALQVAGGVGVVGAIVAGQINSTGNVLGQAGTFNALTVNGNETVTGYLNVTGNVMGAEATFSQVNSAGNVLGAAATFSSAVINGNETVTGYLNVTGNVMAAVVTASQLNTTGNVVGQAGTFNALAVNGNETVTGYLNVTGNVLGADATFSSATVNGVINTSANVLATGGVFNALTVNGNETVTGYLNVTGNVLASTVGASFLTASTVAVGNISAVTIGNAGAVITGLTGAFSGNVIGGLAQFASINATPVGNASASTGAFTTLSASAGIWANSATDTTSLTTGAVVVTGGAAVGKTMWVGEGMVINSTQSAEAFHFKGQGVDNSLIYADPAKNSVVIGGANVTIQDGTSLKVGGTGAMIVPVGATAQRPSSSGNVDVAGMLRFNSTTNLLEFYDSSQWVVAGSIFTVISDRQYAGNVAGGYGNVDGTNTSFTLQANSTTAGSIVSINGVMQFPTLAYSVTNSTLTFTEAPAPSDVIDVRVLATTQTVSALASGNGLNQFIADATGSSIWSGTATTIERVLVDTAGEVNLLTGNKLTYTQTAVNVAANNTPYVVSTWSQTAYTSAKYIITAKRGSGTAGNVETYEAQVVTDGAGSAYLTTYGVVNNGYAMGELSANVLAGNVNVWYTGTVAASVVQANVKAFGTFIV